MRICAASYPIEVLQNGRLRVAVLPVDLDGVFSHVAADVVLDLALTIAIFQSILNTRIVVNYGCLATQQQQRGVWRAAAAAAAWRLIHFNAVI